MFKVETFRELLNGGVSFHVVFGEWLACRELIDDKSAPYIYEKYRRLFDSLK